nr:ribonuclease H-like domain-containing protein [Tanacetum cinerariifolium]
MSGLPSDGLIDIIEPRLSIEYEDRVEMIVAHMVDGVDAFIKVPQGWPIANSAMPENKNSLEWFVRKVQDRIVLSTSRRSLVKDASKSRLFIEYEDRDEMIVAHMVDGVDAFIKVPQGWPIANSALKLSSLKAPFEPESVTLISRLNLSDPLHLHPNDSATLTIVSVKLKGTENYQIWHCAMMLALEGKNKIGFIDGSCRRSNVNEVLGRQ